MSTNPMYESQLNRHEEAISDINGRLHSYDLALKWCEGQIKRLAGDNYSPCVIMNDDEDLKKELEAKLNKLNELKLEINSIYGYNRTCPIEKELKDEKESLERRNDNQRREINQLLKANEELKKEIQELKTKLGVVFAEKENVRGDYERLRQDNLGLIPFEAAYDKLKNDHNLLKEAYKALEDKLMKTQETLEEVREQRDHYARRVEELEEVNKHYEYGVVEATEKVKILNENIEHLERENEHLRELYSCTVESSKKIIDALRKENKE